ncbi:MAG: class I SAM-dependent methyltransferase [Alphaproteobacteria bacterium]|nr:methyltransferase domain-containing protein [Alphaproteobacteria bacterium]MDE2336441.1 class I SAM-dependent methyltransferase [Alphaproteobacteria bacterium]
MTDLPQTCRICHAPFDGMPMGSKNDFTFSACKACGSILASPWPTQEELDAFFGEIQPEIVHVPNPEGRIWRHQKHIKRICADGTGKRFLDVAARQGYAVLAARKLGFQAKGIDSHAFFAAFARDKYEPHLVEHETAQAAAARGEQADLIYVTEGFCEQPDPEGTMAALAKMLAPKGKIYIQEPDGNHLRLPANFPRWDFVEPPLNFCYPSKKGMAALLDRHGLKVEKRFLSWTPFLRLVAVRK